MKKFRNIIKIPASMLALVICLLGVACSTTDDAFSDAPFEVKKGMPVEELVVGLGEPTKRMPYKEGVDGVELWIYVRERTDTKMVSTDIEEIPYIDPVTGYEGTEMRNVMGAELTKSETRTTFLIANGVVEAWRVEEGSKSYL